MQNLLTKLIIASPFVFPLYLLKFEVFGIPLTVPEVFCYALFGLWILSLIVGPTSPVWEKPLRYYWMTAFMLLVGATIGVFAIPHFINLPSGEVLDAQRTALGVWKGWALAPMLYFAVFTQTLRQESQIKTLLYSFIYSGALVALSAYVLCIFGAGITYDLRLSGFFESANYLALYLIAPLLLAIYFTVHQRGKLVFSDYAVFSSFVIMAHAFLFTQSYAGFIAVFGAVAFYVLYLLLKRRVHRHSLITGFLLLTATFAVILFTQVNTPKFQQFLDWENRSSTSVRLEIYEVAYNLIKENPLTGVGPGLFQANYQTNAPDILGQAPMEWNIPHPHNLFLAFWLNAGLLGLVSILLLIGLAHGRFTYPLIALWGILIHGLFDTPFWKNDLALIFWLIIGSIVILQTYGDFSSQIKPSGIRKRLAPRISKRPKN